MEYLVYHHKGSVLVKEGIRRKIGYGNVFYIYENGKINYYHWLTTCPDTPMVLSNKGRVWCLKKEDVKKAKMMVNDYILKKRNSEYYVKKNAAPLYDAINEWLKTEAYLNNNPYTIGMRNMARFVLYYLTDNETLLDQYETCEYFNEETKEHTKNIFEGKTKHNIEDLYKEGKLLERGYNCLTRFRLYEKKGALYLEDLCEFYRWEIKRTRNLGVKTMEHIDDLMKKYGLWYKEDENG